VRPEPNRFPPTVDLPSQTFRWDGLVVSIDATTLNAIAKKAIRNVPRIDELSRRAGERRLGLTVRVRTGIRILFRTHLESLRFKDGYLGFAIADLTVFGFLPVRTGWSG